MRQIVLDTETTGLTTEDGHRIIEIGCVELHNRRLTGNRFHCYINPERDSDPEALEVHGLDSTFLASKPLFSEIVDEFINFIADDAEIIIHNAPFDLKFLNHELGRLQHSFGLIEQRCRIVDTLQIARKLHVGQRNSLDALCKRYSIDNSKRDLHGALLDANLLTQVYLAMTGGQSNFFDMLQNNTHNAHAHLQIVENVSGLSIPICIASKDELTLHAGYLDKMQQKGKCLWLEIEDNQI